MSTILYTETTCDRCGAVAREEGAHGETPPVGWATLSLYWRAGDSGRNVVSEGLHLTLCPACAGKLREVARDKEREES